MDTGSTRRLATRSAGLGIDVDDEGNIIACRPGSVAQRAGVIIPSTIVAINGKRVRGKRELVHAVAAASPRIKLLVSHAVGEDEFDLERPDAGSGVNVADSGVVAGCRRGSAAEVQFAYLYVRSCGLAS